MSRITRKIKTILFKLYHIRFRGTILYETPRVYYEDRLKLGKNIHINDNVFIHAVGGVEIGDYSVLSHGVSIISTKNDIDKWVFRKEDEEIHINERVIIGKNVWLCANVTVCSGVTIGDNIVVAAGSVVTSDLLDSSSLYGGIPCRKIKDI